MIRLANGLFERHIAPRPDPAREPAAFDMHPRLRSEELTGKDEREPAGQQRL